MTLPFLPFPAGVTARLSSPYGPRWGKFHNGVDYALPVGTPLLALAEGQVRFVKTTDTGPSGLYIGYRFEHEGEEYTVSYAHCSEIICARREYVDAGQAIAYSGNSGSSTGPHVHLRVRTDAVKHLDPETLLPRLSLVAGVDW